MTIQNRTAYQGHPFHIINPSPWPFFSSIALLNLTLSAVLAFNNFQYGNQLLLLGFITVVLSMIFWWKDVIVEGTYQGHHTSPVQKGLSLGVALFIVSEIFFFLSIFWAFFHSSLAPTVELGSSWPPIGIQALNPFELPLLNTILLLSSGATVTYAHHSLIQGDRRGVIYGLIISLILAVMFTLLQGFEYWNAPFTISDGVYGSCFFFGTGFHGIHVIIGTLFLGVGLVRIINYHNSDHHHLGFESAILYWHFVDVVWLFLFISIYWWGS